MKNYLTILFLTLIFGVNAQTSDDVLQEFFKALSAKNTTTLDLLMLDDLQLHSLALKDTIVLNTSSKEMFLQNIKSIPEDINIEERIFDITFLKSDFLSQYKVPYEFYINGKLSHSGTNVLTLLKTQEGWKISYIADTRNKES